MATIILDVPLIGDPRITVVGAKGDQCKTLTQGVEKALGTVATTTATREMDETSYDHEAAREQDH